MEKDLGDLYAEMLIRALLQGTDPIKNKGHEVSPCPVCIWEDGAFLDYEVLKPVEK